MESRYLKDLEWRIRHAINIYIYRNGIDGEAPVLIHIPPTRKQTMSGVFSVIQERIKFPIGFAATIYRMDGTRVMSPSELNMYSSYVVASVCDKFFKSVDYGRSKIPLLVLNTESKHIRVLRSQNRNYFELTLKKKVVSCF